jgi:biopolymer transport protein ExbD
MEFKKKLRVTTDIPTASMPDIVFMLLLFFMVTTVFRQYSGLQIDLPKAQRIKKLEAKKNVVNIWANREGEVTIDDYEIQGDLISEKMKEVENKMREKIAENPKLITSLKFDRITNMGLVSDIQQRLRVSNALKVNYCAKFGD